MKKNLNIKKAVKKIMATKRKFKNGKLIVYATNLSPVVVATVLVPVIVNCPIISDHIEPKN